MGDRIATDVPGKPFRPTSSAAEISTATIAAACRVMYAPVPRRRAGLLITQGASMKVSMIELKLFTGHGGDAWGVAIWCPNDGGCISLLIPSDAPGMSEKHIVVTPSRDTNPSQLHVSDEIDQAALLCWCDYAGNMDALSDDESIAKRGRARIALIAKIIDSQIRSNISIIVSGFVKVDQSVNRPIARWLFNAGKVGVNHGR